MVIVCIDCVRVDFLNCFVVFFSVCFENCLAFVLFIVCRIVRLFVLALIEEFRWMCRSDVVRKRKFKFRRLFSEVVVRVDGEF